MKKINLMIKHYVQLLTLIIIFSAQTAMAEEVADYVKNNCGSCHALTQPDYEALGISERIDRKAPHLFYAGNKFRAEWLTSWLQQPTRLRPAGSFPPLHTVVTDEGDVVDEKTLKSHLAINGELAKQVANYLMNLRPNDTLIEQDSYQPKSISKMMGRMNFDKFKGCSACHRDSKEIGGVSGPELQTAWLRMQPEFISSYIKSPVAWDPFSMMSQKHLKQKDVNKLVDYLKIITEQN